MRLLTRTLLYIVMVLVLAGLGWEDSLAARGLQPSLENIGRSELKKVRLSRMEPVLLPRLLWGLLGQGQLSERELLTISPPTSNKNWG